MYWKGGTERGAWLGLLVGFTLWAYTLMLPSIAKSGWIDPAFITEASFGYRLVKTRAVIRLNRIR